MEEVVREKLHEAGVKVFGTMYFMPIQLLDTVPREEKWHLAGSYVAAEIAFSGLMNACVTFYFPIEIVTNIVEGFLGVPPEEITSQQMIDTMQEAANMVIGCFLGKADPEGASKLGIPKAAVVQDFSPKTISDDAMLVFESEFGYLWMRS